MRLLTMFAGVAVAIAALSASASADEINFCTGGKTGNYYAVGQMVSEQAGEGKINVIITAGSWENMQKLQDGTCDVALVQSDAPNAFKAETHSVLANQRVASLYMEYANMICNVNSGIKGPGDLNEKTKVIVGKPGSGAYLTWANLVSEDKDLEVVPTVPSQGEASDLLTLLDGKDAQCMLFIAGKNVPKLQDLASSSEGKLRMIDMNDSSFNNLEDEDGNSVYNWAKISNYDGFEGRWFDVSTFAVRAILYARKDFVVKNQDAFSDFALAVKKALPNIHSQFGAVE